MNKVGWLAVTAVFFTGSYAVAQYGKADDKKTKEVVLFNGKNMDGWGFFLSDKNLKMEDVWSVDPKEKAIICKGVPAGYIYTEKDYTNYVLELEWRWAPDKPPSNSGVLLRLVGEHKIWPRSVEAQLMHQNAGDFWLIDGAKLETDPARVNPNSPNNRRRIKTNEKPAGEWNKYEITVNRDKITLKVNGEMLNEGWGAEVVPGKIALQSEGSEIHFRNIRLKLLD